VKGQALDETCKSSGNWKTKKRGEVCAISEVYEKSLVDSGSRSLVQKEQMMDQFSTVVNTSFRSDSVARSCAVKTSS